MTKANSYGELVIGLAFALGGVGIFIHAAGLRSMPGMAVGSGLFPKITGVLMVLFGLMLAVTAARGLLRNSGSLSESGGPGIALSGYSIIVFLGLIVLTAILPSIGFLLGGIVFTALVCRLGGAGWIGSALFGIGMTVALYAVFVHGLGVQLPRGVLGGMLGV